MRFLDCRKAIRFSMGDEATEGSWRKLTAEVMRSSRGVIVDVIIDRISGQMTVGTEALLELSEDGWDDQRTN